MILSPQRKPSYDFLICRNQQDDTYTLYRVDPHAAELFSPVPLSADASFDHNWRMAQVGGYLLQWSPLCKLHGEEGYQFNLVAFNPEDANPLSGPAIESGFWKKTKFWGNYRHSYSSNPDEGQNLDLTPMTSFILSMIPAKGRGTFELWNFDPQGIVDFKPDPLPAPYSPQNGFPRIKSGHTLIPIGNYVLDRLPDRKSFRLWSFDPQLETPLSLPAVQEGNWDKVDESSELTAIGAHVLEWNAAKGLFRLWGFDPQQSEVLIGPVREGKLPSGIAADAMLTGYQPRIPVQAQRADTPGNIDFMRSKIKHVVYYMLESRSFDNVCGWLYENGDQDCHYIGSQEAFDGASREYFNDDGDNRVSSASFRQVS